MYIGDNNVIVLIDTGVGEYATVIGRVFMIDEVETRTWRCHVTSYEYYSFIFGHILLTELQMKERS